MKSKTVKFVPCLFFPNIRCLRRDDVKSREIERCMGCAYLKRFEEEMEAEEEEFFEEVDEVRRKGVWC